MPPKLSERELQVYEDILNGLYLDNKDSETKVLVSRIRNKLGPESVVKDPEKGYALGLTSNIVINMNERRVEKLG